MSAIAACRTCGTEPLANAPVLPRLSGFKKLICGASPMPEGVLRNAFEVFPNCQFFHCYGMTEAAPVLTVLPPRYATLIGPYAGRLRSCGLAVHTTELKIVDENR